MKTDLKAVGIRLVVSQGHKSKWMLGKPNDMPNHTGTQDEQEKDEAEVARLTDILATGATGDNTRKEYNGRVRTFAIIRAARGKGPWLLEKDGVEEVVRELTTFMFLSMSRL